MNLLVLILASTGCFIIILFACLFKRREKVCIREGGLPRYLTEGEYLRYLERRRDWRVLEFGGETVVVRSDSWGSVERERRGKSGAVVVESVPPGYDS